MKSNLIKKIQNNLKNYFTYLKTDSIIIVSMSKDELPFAYIIEDENYPNKLLIAFAVNFPIANIAGSLVLEVNKIKEVLITENFYISNGGMTYWGEEAVDKFHIDNIIDLESLEAASEQLN